MSLPPPPLSEILRLNQIGRGVERQLRPDAETRARVARLLDLAELSMFEADMAVKPAREGWRLTGALRAEAIQTCGVTLEPLPVKIQREFAIDLIEAVEREDDEIDVDLERDGPDEVEDGAIDLGVYAVEQLALRLDPFPRKPGAVFTPPETEAEISPFAILRDLKARSDGDKG
jgi:uncharacterized metal-binding protein YceD (DUF177 family)